MIKGTTTLRVRYKETDQMGVVYYSNYLVWFEVARTELFREIGLPYTDIEKNLGLRLMVAEARCKYLAPARYDDLINIDCQIKDVKNSSLTFTYKVMRDDSLLAEGMSLHVFADAKGKPKRMPKEIKEKLV